jgi:hypothetical protein
MQLTGMYMACDVTGMCVSVHVTAPGTASPHVWVWLVDGLPVQCQARDCEVHPPEVAFGRPGHSEP